MIRYSHFIYYLKWPTWSYRLTLKRNTQIVGTLPKAAQWDTADCQILSRQVWYATCQVAARIGNYTADVGYLTTILVPGFRFRKGRERKQDEWMLSWLFPSYNRKPPFKNIGQKMNVPLCRSKESTKSWLCFLPSIERRLNVYTSPLRLWLGATVFNGPQGPLLVCWQAVAILRYLQSLQVDRCHRQPRIPVFEYQVVNLVQLLGH